MPRRPAKTRHDPHSTDLSPAKQAAHIAQQKSQRASRPQTEALRDLPSVHSVVERLESDGWVETIGKTRVTLVVRQVIDHWRQEISHGRQPLPESNGAGAPSLLDQILTHAMQHLEQTSRTSLPRVINATGIILHTGLGRAPLAEAAVDALAEAAGGYAPVELDLETGRRGHRRQVVENLLCELTGAQAATVVNNNAAALLITLNTLARDREVIVSRGELIEIGGSFRLPTIIQAGGAILREVGTTNKTRISDYHSAINENTAAILKVHPSNFRVHGFTAQASIEELRLLAAPRELPLVHDIGSGLVSAHQAALLPSTEPMASDSINAGADVVLFSGDKLLGGPQCGIIVGEKAIIQRIESNPLMRVVRTDKLTLAALAATLEIHIDPQRTRRDIPILAMLAASVDQLSARASRITDALSPIGHACRVGIVSSQAYMGGGSVPDEQIESIAVQLVPEQNGLEEIAKRLRTAPRGVIPRIQDGAIMLDLRTVALDDDDQLVATVIDAFDAPA